MFLCHISSSFLIQQLRRIAGIAQRDAVGDSEGGGVAAVVEGVGPSGIDGEGHAGRVGSSGAVGTGGRSKSVGVGRVGGVNRTAGDEG